MFMVTIEEIEKELFKINDYIAKCLWLDFTIGNLGFGKIHMFGSVDDTHLNYIDNFDIRIDFEMPHFIEGLICWQADVKKPFIQLVNSAESKYYNQKYNVEIGNYIFKINAEDYNKPPIYIAAKKITSVINSENPF